MKCIRCNATDGLNKIVGLSFELNGVDRQQSVAVTGIHCGHCGFLALEMNSAAAPVEVTQPIK
jgi:transcription elongation factor Elf1